MRERLGTLRAMLSVGVVLVLLVAVVGAGVAYEYQETQRLQDERALLEEEVAGVQERLRSYQRENDVAALREELRQLRSNPTEAGLPSRQEVLRLGAVLTEDASSRGVELVAFASVDTTVPAGEERTLPGMELSLEARGPLERLVELVGVVDRGPSARVRELTLSRGEEPGVGWVMELIVVMPYQQ